MIDVVWLIKDFIDSKCDLQEWANRRYKDGAKVPVDLNIVKKIVTNEGLVFGTRFIEEIQGVMREYQFKDITKDDVVLDLGANAGGFSLRAALVAKRVYAVEPIFHNELETTIVENGMAGKVQIIRAGLGNGDVIPISYRKETTMVQTLTLPDILKRIPYPVTFLKVDVEGAEWSIKPEQLNGIPRIEFECHFGEISCLPVNYDLIEYIKKNWKTRVTVNRFLPNSMWLHAYPKNKDGR